MNMHSKNSGAFLTGAYARQDGFSLLEVLIAIVVLSFGLLGMLGLLLNSYKLTSSSNYRTIAAEQAQSIAESLRANSYAALVYDVPNMTASASSACFQPLGCPSTSGSQERAATLAATEFRLLQTRVQTMLPGSDVMVCRDVSPNDGDPSNWKCDPAPATPPPNAPFVVKICWDERNVTGSQTTATATTPPALECVRTVI